MPPYQYACTECGHDLEQFQSFTDDALTTCPVCEGRLRKVFNAVGVVFKGSGFYRNDSRTGSGSDEKPAAKVEGESKSTDEKSSTPKTESSTPDKAAAKDKPAAKPAATKDTTSAA